MKHLLLAATLSLTASAALACETVTLGDLSVEHGWSKVTIGAGRPGVFYVSISNAGATDDALVGISTPAAGMPMLHETVVKDGVASMPHAMSIPVPAGQSVQLSPGGYHGMLMGLTAALKEGDSFPVTLSFEKAGEVTVNVEVLSLRAEGPDCADAGHNPWRCKRSGSRRLHAGRRSLSHAQSASPWCSPAGANERDDLATDRRKESAC
ncbi:MAG: copper chaperone PCu(A)C [Pseudotabrizicola sp.]|uniref:copper chaperone PCu(A)C n=1 Tax=Pseudotabrizicola sp. TaxID=2939647 RepID=UPI002ACED56E|nr:copper chaperone PCu(A)C [Pseudotabrizicola sp.]MDZ7573459.1 copper chaperone PCu(A)C [Pseudotabrizicola sp.]